MNDRRFLPPFCLAYLSLVYNSQSGYNLDSKNSIRYWEMAKKKAARHTIQLRSSESSHMYSTQKNKNNTTGRVELMKFDPIVKKHVMYKEKK